MNDLAQKTTALLMALFVAPLASCHKTEDRPAHAYEQKKTSTDRPCVDLNSATVEELMSLPGIGEARARKIVEHRTRYGPFNRPEEIIIIDGFSERRFRSLKELICVR